MRSFSGCYSAVFHESLGVLLDNLNIGIILACLKLSAIVGFYEFYLSGCSSGFMWLQFMEHLIKFLIRANQISKES